MLPKYHYDSSCSEVFNDSSWISEQLDKLPISIQREIAQKYSDIYLKLSNDDPRFCRKRANTWLRKVVDKYKVTNKEGYF